MSKIIKYVPELVVWEITYQCNANCIHCGSDCSSSEKINVLSTEQCLNIIDDLERLGSKVVFLSGGEPLLRKDFFKLAKALNSKYIKVGIISNGIAVNKKNINSIKKINPVVFGISLDAGTEYLHDYIRGRQGTFKSVINTIDLLKENNIPISIVTTIHKLNFGELTKIRNLLIQLKIRNWQIQYADNIGRMPIQAMITEAQFFELSKFIYETKMKYDKHFDIVTGADVMGYMSDYAEFLQNGKWQGCQAGLKVLGLGCDGSVRGCLSLQRDDFIEDYIGEKSLYEIWNNNTSFKYNRHFTKEMLSGYCKKCKHANICRGGCVRAATSACKTRCSKYCLYKIEKCGYSNPNEAKICFSKKEISLIYNKIKHLPSEFYKYYTL